VKRFGFVTSFVGLFLFVNFITRAVLLLLTYDKVDTHIVEILKLFLIGFFYDMVAVSYYLIPFIIYIIIMPDKFFNTKFNKMISFVVFFCVIYATVFNAFSEYFFWDEFGKRFNFIAVDYLVYTHEVIHNILESYPIPLLLSIIFMISLILFVLIRRYARLDEAFSQDSTLLSRAIVGVVWLVVPFMSFNLLDKQTITHKCHNKFNQELAKDGLYSLFSAFRHNELDYDEFYKTLDIKYVLKHLKNLLSNKNEPFATTKLDYITKVVTTKDTPHTYNIVLIMVESLSAEYLGAFGDKRGLTPHLDEIAKQSLFFNNLYATGTRTVRGMEAVTLSLPPTPGRSIVKRPDCDSVNSFGFVTKKLGYENKFIYAGHGYFDNMNYFFSHNGFEIVDRFDFAKDEVTFSNVWGVCDEDLFAKVIKEADKSYAKSKPFFSFVMTTSNHRPYTYPNGKIDIPSHTGRYGGVKYTDYAIDKFIKQASKKEWFDKTLFVIVADHNGGSAGKTELPLWRYKIPFMIYAPKIIKPQVVSKLSSQIDVMPTILGILDVSYKAKFYGDDILKSSHKQRAFIGNYQKLGLFRDNKLTILSPDKGVTTYQVKQQSLYSTKYTQKKSTQQDVNDIISYYQSASYLYKHHLLGM